MRAPTRTRRLADRLDAAINGLTAGLPAELAPLVAVAAAIRDAAQRIQPGPSRAGPRILAALAAQRHTGPDNPVSSQLKGRAR